MALTAASGCLGTGTRFTIPCHMCADTWSRVTSSFQRRSRKLLPQPTARSRSTGCKVAGHTNPWPGRPGLRPVRSRDLCPRGGALRSFTAQEAQGMVTKHPRKLPRLRKGENMRHMFGKLAAAGTITAALVLTPAIASAGTGTGQEFGQHV